MCSRGVYMVTVTLSVVLRVGGLENALARRPPLGWMSWGYYMCADKCEQSDKCLNEELIMSVADELWSGGYVEAGYEFVVIDDCWSERVRDARGWLVPDRARFPRGMNFLADYVNKRGLKLGLYGSAGRTTCMGYPGSRHHLREDAQAFAQWGVDYVKFDGCFVGLEELNSVYIEFGKELNKTGRPMVYSCSWPYYVEYIHHLIPDYKKVIETCNLWRNYHDIFPSWGSVVNIISHYQTEHKRMASYAAPGHWNDPDMLLVGSGVLGVTHSRVQLAVWAMLSAPLLLSCDLAKAKQWERSLLTNPHLLAIDQDPMGQQAVPHQLNHALTVWVKRQTPIVGNKYHSFSLAFVNLGHRRETVKISLLNYGLASPDGYTVVDVFEYGLPIQNITLHQQLTVVIPSQDAVLYTLFPL